MGWLSIVLLGGLGLLVAASRSVPTEWQDRTWPQKLEVAGFPLDHLWMMFALLTGVGALLVLLTRRHAWHQPTEALAPWATGDGYAVLFFGMILAVLITRFYWLTPKRFALDILDAWYGLWIAIPFLFLTRRYLLRPGGHGFFDTFGLRGSGRTGARLIGDLLVVMGLVEVGVFGLGCLEPGSSESWKEAYREQDINGSVLYCVFHAVGMVIWAPLCEEIVFRGILYGTLRRHLTPVPAALLCGIAFGVAHHQYSEIGYLQIMWTSVAYCLVYERIRTLLPLIVAHGIVNGLSYAHHLVALR